MGECARNRGREHGKTDLASEPLVYVRAGVGRGSIRSKEIGLGGIARGLWNTTVGGRLQWVLMSIRRAEQRAGGKRGPNRNVFVTESESRERIGLDSAAALTCDIRVGVTMPSVDGAVVG